MTKRKLLVVVAVVVVVAAATVTTVVLTRSNSTPSAKPCEIPKSVREKPVSAKTAPGGGGIRVVEQGFSQASADLSMGAVLQNTSDRTAYRTKVAFRIFASPDHEPSEPPEEVVMTTEIPVMMPGQQVGVGRGAGLGWGRVTSVATERKTTTWLPKGALGSQFVPTATTYKRMIPPYDVVRYTENSENCRALTNRRTAVVFRDAGGKIVGGDLADPDGKGRPVSGQQPPSSPSCSPGERETWIVPPTGAPPNVDGKRTRLYSYCDLNAPPSDVNQTY
ncbi:MAG: hypothetical protein GEU98_16680 [Pseudonocardiaceae bacterium]|nr:hypothetical protein [Pseudonocardiaceae bacterium]